MNNRLQTVLILCSLTLPVLAQEKLGHNSGGMLLRIDKPTVYLTFERAGKRKPLYTSESNRGVWLRLHNNTKWALSLCTLSSYVGTKVTPVRISSGNTVLALHDGVEVTPCHGVEVIDRYESKRARNGGIVIDESVEVPNPPAGYNRGHGLETSWLPPGGSVIFSVPREHLAKRLAIYITFNYEWEFGEHGVRRKEPEHRVYFRASELPENIESRND